MNDDTKFIRPERLAVITGLPLAWLKREAREGRIPSLKVGRRLMFDRDAVERALIKRAQERGDNDGEK